MNDKTEALAETDAKTNDALSEGQPAETAPASDDGKDETED